MAIKDRPSRDALDDVIRGAPDAHAEDTVDGEAVDAKQQISLMMLGSLIKELDTRAKRNGMSRAALVNLYVRQGLDRGAP